MQAGDTVAYSAKFLRSIADYSHKSASKRFIIERIDHLDKDFSIVVCQCGSKINIKNLSLVKKGMVLDAI